MSGLNVKVYEGKHLGFKTIISLLLFGMLGGFLLFSGFHHYASASSDFQKFRAGKTILVGGLIFIFFGFGLFGNFMQIIFGPPRLILSDRQISYQKMRDKVLVYNWSDISFFEPLFVGSKGKAWFIKATVLNPKSDKLDGSKKEFLLPVRTFSSEISAFLDDINQRRAAAVGEQYMPHPNISEMQSRKPIQSWRYWVLWFFGVYVIGCLFVKPACAFFDLPLHPYQGYATLGLIIFAALLSTYKTVTRKQSQSG